MDRNLNIGHKTDHKQVIGIEVRDRRVNRDNEGQRIRSLKIARNLNIGQNRDRKDITGNKTEAKD